MEEGFGESKDVLLGYSSHQYTIRFCFYWLECRHNSCANPWFSFVEINKKLYIILIVILQFLKDSLLHDVSL